MHHLSKNATFMINSNWATSDIYVVYHIQTTSKKQQKIASKFKLKGDQVDLYYHIFQR